ncbi:MAG: hypothetical protein ACR2MD_16130 [Aridibacter sp.]
MDDNFVEKKTDLKIIRDKFLSFHKILMDWDRDNYEMENGNVTAGKFLEMLLSDQSFEWLRTISTLIVRIDEAYDLDDGVSDEMLVGFYKEINDLFDESSEEYKDFKYKINSALPELREARNLKTEIINILNKQKQA